MTTTVTVRQEHLEQLDTSTLITLIQDAIRILCGRGARRTLTEMLAGEIEDLQLEQMSSKELGDQAAARDRDVGGGVA